MDLFLDPTSICPCIKDACNYEGRIAKNFSSVPILLLSSLAVSIAVVLFEEIKVNLYSFRSWSGPTWLGFTVFSG